MGSIAKDLVILVADKNTEQGIRGLLSRPEALAIRQITYDVFVHPDRDPGCRTRADTFLHPFEGQYSHALVLFDREGCGSAAARESLQDAVLESVSRSGWGNRCAVIVLDPELEIWVWSDSSHVDDVLGWNSQPLPLRIWLREQGYLDQGQTKPARPKEAMEAALREVRKPRSSSLYRQLAERVSLRGHSEPAFCELLSTLQAWFPR